jgi:phosphoribosylformylglycinamidine synthase I
MLRPKIAVLTGFGFNCEQETYYIFKKSGGDPEYVHINDLIYHDRNMNDYQILAFIGGFSFGDHIAGGRVMAVKCKYRLQDMFNSFLKKDKLIIGICNGFQALVKLGILPRNSEYKNNQAVTLTHNDHPGYRDDWIYLKCNIHSPCIFTRDIEYLELPIRHGEGKFLCLNNEVVQLLKKNKQIVFQYADPFTGNPTQQFPFNPNGSVEAIAGICSPDGKIFGLMPHPEAFHTVYNHPQWYIKDKIYSEEGDGVKIFKNAVEYFL